MSDAPLNIERLPHNTCFGCGHLNPEGLQIEVRPDADRRGRLVGRFVPAPRTTGFPGVVHGGALFTAMDCFATWVVSAARAERAIWILRGSEVTYHRPAAPGGPLLLSGVVTREGGAWEPVTVRVEVRSDAGELVAEGSFREIPLTEEKFVAVAGIEALPDNWRHFLDTVRLEEQTPKG